MGSASPSSVADVLRNHRNLAWFMGGMVGIALVLLSLAAVVGLSRPESGDEAHFVQTIRQFGQQINFEQLRTYEEMSTPLPFVAYGLWGRLFGFELPALRIGGILVALATHAVYLVLLLSLLGRRLGALLAFLLFVLHPYTVYLSLFVHTDIPAVGLALLGLVALRDGRPLWLAVALAGAVLCRQYLVFLSGAVMVFCSLRWFIMSDRRAVTMGLAAVASLLPFIALLVLWRAPHPDNQVQKLYIGNAFSFHPGSLVVYLMTIGVYLLPILCVRVAAICADRWLWSAAVVLSPLYWLWPVAPSPSAVIMEIPTVGFFHRLLHGTVGQGWFEHSILFAGFFLGLLIVGRILIDMATRIRDRQLDFVAFMDLVIFSFLIVMPFSYLHWEKYLMPVYPVLIVRLLLMGPRHDRAAVAGEWV